jgi:hypothetical protein
VLVRFQVGAPADAEHVRSALAGRDVFIYCGHGGGDAWLGSAASARRRGSANSAPVHRCACSGFVFSAVRRCRRLATSLLLGCSSGALRVRHADRLGF